MKASCGSVEWAEVLMTLLHRLFYAGCLAVLLTPCGQAQTSSESDTSASNSSPGGWLGTEEPKAVAWRAYEAMLTHDKSAMSELLSLSSEWQPLSPQTPSDDGRWRHLSSEQEKERDAMTVVLDALIQLKAPVPGTALRNLAVDFETAAAILLARMPIEESGPLSLELYRSPVKPDSTLQYVSAALLALHPRPRFAGKLLEDITVQAKVFVIRLGDAENGFGSIGDCFGSAEPEREGWPKVGQYKLSTQLGEGASILVGGTKPVYVTRVESARYVGNDCGMSGMYLGREQRRAFIAEMLRISPEEIPWETDVQRNIEFTSLGQFTAALLAFIEEQQQMYRHTAEALQARGLLAASEVSQSMPLMELDLTDARRIGSSDEDSDEGDSNDKRDAGLEPISREAIKLPARVVWAE
jgi:hypothetical protein